MKRYVAVFASAVMMTFALAGPASAAYDVQVSSDGTSWSSAYLPGDLFDNTIMWVPGDTRTATFYVRNTSDDPTKMSIDLLGNHLGTLLDLGAVHITAKSGKGKWTVASDGALHRLLTGTKIKAGASVPVTVNVAYDFSSSNASQLLSTDLKFRVTLTQTGSGVDLEGNNQGNGDGNGSGTGTGTGSGNGNADLPDTGAPNSTWIVALGSILLGIGFAVTSRRRNDPQGESHV